MSFFRAAIPISKEIVEDLEVGADLPTIEEYLEERIGRAVASWVAERNAELEARLIRGTADERPRGLLSED